MAPATLSALVFTKEIQNPDHEFLQGIVITRADFILEWVDWDKNNDDFDLCVRLAWEHLCSKCDEVANGEGYVHLPNYDEETAEEDEVSFEDEVGFMVGASLGHAEHMAGEIGQDPE